MYLEVDEGVALHVEVLGQDDGDHALPVVMLHGLLVGNMASWYFTVAQALARTRKVVLFDLRGHGQSTRARSGYDVETMTRDLCRIVEEQAGERVVLVGHSYGAVVAMNFALKHPARVDKLCVVEAPLPPTGLRELDAFVAQAPEAMLDALPEALRSAVSTGRRSGRRFVDAMRFLAMESTLFDDLRSASDFTDETLSRLTCPTLAIYGTRSSCRPVGQRLLRHCPKVTLVELEGGHFLPLEAPRPLTLAIASFLDG